MQAATAPAPVDPAPGGGGHDGHEPFVASLQPPEHGLRSAKRKSHYYRNQWRIAQSYMLDGFAMLLFWLAGTVDWKPAAFYTLAGVSVCAFWAGLRRLGWTDHLEDPEVTMVWWTSNVSVQLVAMWLVPELNFMFVLILFIVYISLTLRSTVRRAAISCMLVSVGVGAVLAFSGEGLHVPDGNRIEQALAAGFFALTLWRCLLLGAFNSHMTALMKQRSAELAELTRKAEHLAHHDELTGLLNRRSLIALMEQERLRAMRHGRALSVAMLDLDHFKAINDRLGHQAGDETLKTFARNTRSVTRKTDRLGRYGGEEFLLMLVDTNAQDAWVAVERIRQALVAAGWSHIAPDFNVTFSCGIASLQGEETIDATIKRADDALYRAKQDGRNRTCLG
jgi:diguanylate cyclase (GGDEF)-like protein